MISRRKFLLGGVAATAAAPLSRLAPAAPEITAELGEYSGMIFPQECWVNFKPALYWWNGETIYYLDVSGDYYRWGDNDGGSNSGRRDAVSPTPCDIGPAVRRLFDDSRRKIPVRSGWVLHPGGALPPDQQGNGGRLEGDSQGRGEALTVPQVFGQATVTVAKQSQYVDLMQGGDDISDEAVLEDPRD